MASTSAAPMDRTFMTRAFQAADSSAQSLKNDLNRELVALKIIAEDIERHEPGSDKIKALDDVAVEWINAVNELESHRHAIGAINETYTTPVSNESTDFKRLIQAEMAMQTAAPAKNSDFYKQFQEAIWNVHHSGVPMPGREQEEICITSNQVGILNRQCPISGKPVTELINPVRSVDCRHIYERDAVMGYIGRRQKQRCAAAGCPKDLEIRKLICDGALQMDIQELRVRGESNQGPPPDLTELDDDEG